MTAMPTKPQQQCQVCGDVEIVRPDGRGFPPDIAKRRLAKRCKAAGHRSEPRYTAGVNIALWPATYERVPDDAG